MVENFKQWLGNKNTALLVPPYGIAIQIAAWGVVFLLAVATHWWEPANFVVGILSLGVLAVPLLGLFGIYAGITYMVRHGLSFTPMLGCVVSLLWLLVGLGVPYLLISSGVTV